MTEQRIKLVPFTRQKVLRKEKEIITVIINNWNFMYSRTERIRTPEKNKNRNRISRRNAWSTFHLEDPGNRMEISMFPFFPNALSSLFTLLFLDLDITL
jgi:hypothetical protein